MHTIRYCPIQVASVSGSGHNQVQPEDIVKLPPSLLARVGSRCRPSGGSPFGQVVERIAQKAGEGVARQVEEARLVLSRRPG
jgi:hypothetical protein